MAQFQCRYRNTTDLCFDPSGEAECGITPEGWETCVCSMPTYGPDNLYLHLPTCTLPKNFYEGYLAAYIMLMFIWAVVFAPVYKVLTPASLARRIVLLTCLHQMLLVVFALCLLLQRGNFEAAPIVYALKNCVLVALIHSLLVMMLEPIYLGAGKCFLVVRRRLCALSVFNCVCLFVYGVVLAAYTRNDRVHNHIALGSISLNAFLSFCATVALVKITAQMIKTLALLPQDEEIVHAKNRLKRARKNFLAIAFMIGTSPLLFVPYVILGSIPYAFAFAVGIDMVGFGIILPLQIYIVLRQKSAKKRQSNFSERQSAGGDQGRPPSLRRNRLSGGRVSCDEGYSNGVREPRKPSCCHPEPSMDHVNCGAKDAGENAESGSPRCRGKPSIESNKAAEEMRPEQPSLSGDETKGRDLAIV